MQRNADRLGARRRRAALSRLCVFFAVWVVTAGCGVEEQSNSDNHGFGWEYQAQAANDLKLRNEPDVVEPIPLDVLADIYDQTQACTGISAQGPFVIVVSQPVDDQGRPGGQSPGLTFYEPPLILIMQGATWVGIAQHEFVHYLLEQNGFPLERNDAHDSPFFSDCVHFCGLLGCT
jgi:hypothetical protein